MAILKEDNGDAVAGVNTQYTMSVGDVFRGTLNNTTDDEENPFVGIEVDKYSTPTFADLDNDGDLDLVVGEYEGILHYYENTGTRSQPVFTERTGAANPLDGIDVGYGNVPTFADLDGDGDLDLVVGEWDGVLNYYENTGSRTNADFTLDEDWIRVELTAGTIYRISLEGVGATAEGTQFRLSLLDSSGDNILSTVSGSDAVIDVHRVSATGTYYLKVESWDNNVLDYEVSVVENTTPEGTYDEIADYLTDGFSARSAFDVGPGGTLTADISALTPAGQQFARWALEAWTSVTGIGFEFVDGDAHITFDDEDDAGGGGYAYSNTWNGEIESSFVNVWKGNSSAHATIESRTLYAYLHEIGHALGLGHPGPYSGEVVTYSDHAKFLNDSEQVTVMSYFSQEQNIYIEASYAYPVTPMIADIIAIQNLYGAPTDMNLGDTVYGYRSNVDGYLGQLFLRWAGEGNPFVDIDVGDYSTPTFADLDNDGDLDLVVGEWDGTLNYYENTGSRSQPNFTERTGVANPLPLDGIGVDYASAPVFADLDGDGDLDLVVGEWDGTLNYYENTGSRSQPSFTERIGVDNPLGGIEVDYDSAPTFADLDNDGDLDLVMGEEDGALNYYENTGSRSQPNFTERTGVANPLPLDGIGVDYASAPVFADLDGDGDLDLVVGEWDGTLNYYENTGTHTGASFTSLQRLSQPVALTLYDNGGSDTLDLRTDTADQQVDLRPEGISDVYGLVGNLVIARGTVIEHFIAGSGNDTVDGNMAANHLAGRAGNDRLWGSGGNDVLEGGAGADRLHGGTGMDTVSYQGSDAGVAVKLREGTGTRGHAEGDVIAEVENVIGSDHNDTLVGDSLDNLLTGNAGNDLLWGSAGNDLLIGGPGADRLVGNSGYDTASWTHSPTGVTVRLHNLSATGGDATGDTFPYRVDVAWTDSDGVEQTESLPDVEHLSGSAHDDVLAGDRRDNVIDGGAGHDTLYGGPGGGDDRLDGGPGNDRLYGGQGSDRLAGAAGDDRLVGGPRGGAGHRDGLHRRRGPH